jgi:hypothetical protein
MFCRYCGANIAEDSVFCARCGKRLGRRTNPRVDKLVRTLYLKTPYPYFALLFIVFTAWAIGPRKAHVDYSHLKWTLEVDRKLDVPEDKTFQQGFSLVLENTGTTTVQNIPVELLARIEPMKPAEVIASYRGRQLLITQKGKPLPLELVLEGQVAPATKRRYGLDGTIQAEPPFKVTYEIRDQDSTKVLTSFVVER